MSTSGHANESQMNPPLAIDLYCGLGGWTEGFLAEGYRVIGFDIERHVYGEHRYPAQLVIQDVLTLHGSQFKDAAVIVASPPCQEPSYRAMCWKRAKALTPEEVGKPKPEWWDIPEKPSKRLRGMTAKELSEWKAWKRDFPKPPPLTFIALFNACFRIQREACEAAGRHIPLIVENVRGAEKWVGSARWHFGSYYLWGDVPAIMPFTFRASKLPAGNCSEVLWKDRKVGRLSHQTPAELGATNQLLVERDGIKCPGRNFYAIERGQSSPSLNGAEHETRGVKTVGHVNKRDGYAHTRHLANQRESDGVKQHGSGPIWFDTGIACHSSQSSSRKAASAMIAKIPFPLAVHIARCFKPEMSTSGHPTP